MKLLNDERHCSGVILAKGNNHACAKRETCLRYTESVRKTDGWIVYMAAIDDCKDKIEVR